MRMINEDIGLATIELQQELKGEKYNWCHIEFSPRNISIEVYEVEKAALQLFSMNKEQAKQLANTLSMLAERMENEL